MDDTQKAIVETLIQHASQMSDHERLEGNEAASQTLLRMGQWMQHMKDELAAVTAERDALREAVKGVAVRTIDDWARDELTAALARGEGERDG